MITSMPSTQCTVDVERATVTVRRRTRTAVQKRPPATDSRARSHSSSRRLMPVLKAASGPTSRPLGDTYRISGPHQACKVVAAAHHIKVDVLAQVEARVLFRPTEAGRVEIEHDQRRAAASHRLEKPNPLRVRARGDDRDGAPRQAPAPVPGEGLRPRCAPVGLAHGEVVEDETVLPHRPVRLEQSALRVAGDQSYV